MELLHLQLLPWQPNQLIILGLKHFGIAQPHHVNGDECGQVHLPIHGKLNVSEGGM